MRNGGGKHKGGQFEREIAVKLSLWITHGKRKDCLWRSAMSGGRATVHNTGRYNSDIRQAGDICAVAPEGNVFSEAFYVEVKHLKSIDFIGLLKGNGTLVKVWQKTRRLAAKYKRNPVLIIKQNRCPILWCSDQDNFLRLLPKPKVHDPLIKIYEYKLHIYLFDKLTKYTP